MSFEKKWKIPKNLVISNAIDVYIQSAESYYVNKFEAIFEKQKDLDILWSLLLQKIGRR